MIERLMWLVTVASIVATVANIHKRQWCFVIWLATNILWALYDVHKTAYPQAALQIVYAGLSAWGIWKWRARRADA